jgi:hypothetical protein
MVIRTGMLIEAQLWANEMECGRYHVERQAVRERLPGPSTIDGWKHVVIG